MLGFGVVQRLASGCIADRIGGVRTLIFGSALQCLALLFYMPFDGLISLYVVSAFFGLAQGGIVPSYALIVRDHFPPARRAGASASCSPSTVLGMALGGWLSGEIFDYTGSYRLPSCMASPGTSSTSRSPSGCCLVRSGAAGGRQSRWRRLAA